MYIYILLIKLKYYGIRGLSLAWLSSCILFKRTQKVKVNNILSNSQFITAGVPKGSILVPILFNLFYQRHL